MDKTEADLSANLAKELKELTKEIRKLKNQDFMKIFSHPWKFMWYSLLRGLMVGLGTVLGATILVAIFIYILAQISVVPIVGDFVESVIQEVESVRQDIANPADPLKDTGLLDKYNEAKSTVKDAEDNLLNTF